MKKLCVNLIGAALLISSAAIFASAASTPATNATTHSIHSGYYASSPSPTSAQSVKPAMQAATDIPVSNESSYVINIDSPVNRAVYPGFTVHIYNDQYLNTTIVLKDVYGQVLRDEYGNVNGVFVACPLAMVNVYNGYYPNTYAVHVDSRYCY